MRKMAFAAAAVLLAATPVSAQWVYQAQGGAFDNEKTHLAFTGTGDYGFGLRCKGDRVEALYMVPDPSMTGEALELANLSGPELLVRVDENEPIEITGVFDDNDGTAALIVDVDGAMINQIVEARSGVSVAMRLLGQIYHEQKFSVAGSTRAGEQLLSGCPSLGD